MKKNAGFTLVEILVVVVLIGILAGIAIPSILSWLPNIRQREATRDLFLDFQHAKMEAIKRNANVVIVFNNVACPGLPSAVPSPGGSYTVFVDNGPGVFANNNVQDAGEPTLFQKTMPSNVAFCAQTFGGVTGFLPNGLLIGNNIGSATISNDKGRSAAVALTIAGGIRVN